MSLVSASPRVAFFLTAHAATDPSANNNERQAQRLISYLKKHSNSIQAKGSNLYYRQVLWQLLAIDFKTLSGPTKRELMNLLFAWSGANLSDNDRADLERELKKKLDGELEDYWNKMRLAVLKDIDARDLTKELRQALKDAFGRLQMSKAGMNRLDILDKDEDRFINEMLFAGVMPSTSSDLANLGNDLLTNLAANTISGNFTPQQLTTMAKNIAKALGISNSTTGKLLGAAVNDKAVQGIIGQGKLPDVQKRLQEVQEGLERSQLIESNSQTDLAPNQKSSLGDSYEKALRDEAKLAPKALSHTNTLPKIQNARARTSKSTGDLSQKGLGPFSSSAVSDTAPSRAIPIVSTSSVNPVAPPPPAKADLKLESAREVVDPRELLGGSYVFRNPKYTTTDPLLEDKKHLALGDYGSKYFELAQEASIRAGSKIGSCDLKETRSDKLCSLEACKNAKPCKCLEGMLKTVQDFELNRTEKEATAGAPEDVVASRIQETGNTVESSVRQALKIKYDEIRQKLHDPAVPKEEKDKLLDGTKNVEELEKREAIERSFYIKKVLLNGVMNTKTPACVLTKGRYGIGAKRDPETEPEWIFPNEDYCHQFDIKPDEAFSFDPQKPGKNLSQQDEILLRLALRTLDGLEDSSNKGLSKEDVLGGWNSKEIKVGEQQVCASRSLCTLPDPVSRKPHFYRIFADESKNLKTQKLFDRKTDNTIARTLLRCFGPREWGGMLIRMLEYLQPMAERCAHSPALILKPEIKKTGLLKAVCSLGDDPTFRKPFDISKEQEDQLLLSAESAKRTRKHLVFPFDRPLDRNLKDYCEEIKSKYSALLDILHAATLLNPGEICSDERLKVYEKKIPNQSH